MKRITIATLALLAAIVLITPLFFPDEAPAPEAQVADPPAPPAPPPTYPASTPTELDDDAFSATPSGLEQAVIEPGSGAIPPADHLRQAAFTMWHADDLSVALVQAEPGLTTRIGVGNLPPALEEALSDMRIGERRQLRFGPALGYGSGAPAGVRSDASFIAEVTLTAAPVPRRPPAYPSVPEDAWQGDDARFAILTPGEGPSPAEGTLVRFDLSVFSEGDLRYTSMNIGQPRIIRWGLDRAVPAVLDALGQMKVGETRVVRVPPERGWSGLDAHPTIPGDAVVEAMITLQSVEPMPGDDGE